MQSYCESEGRVAVGETGIPLWRRAIASEGAMWRSLFRWVRRAPLSLDPGDQTFGSLGVIKPVLGVFLGLSIVEIPIFDLIIRHVVPWRPARWIMLVISLWGLLWMIGFFASLKSRPHIVGARGIRVRAGTSVDLTVPWDSIDTVRKRYRSTPSGKSVQIEPEGDRKVLHIVAASQTSIDVRLRQPAAFLVPKGQTEPVDEVRLYADDPDSFERAARDVLAARAQGPQ